MMSYVFFQKYNLKIIDFETMSGTGIAYSGEPKYPNGYLLGIISSRIPMRLRYFRTLSFIEELDVIKNIISEGKPNERYPLISEVGQVAVYKDKAYVYDTIKGGSVFDEMDVFIDTNDDKDEEPIMILPSSDLLGILLDFQEWKNNQSFLADSSV